MNTSWGFDYTTEENGSPIAIALQKKVKCQESLPNP